MIRFGFTKDDGTHVVMLGLTDVNVRLLLRGAIEPPATNGMIRVHGRDFGAPEDASLADAEFVVFHASRAACIEIADELGIDQKVLLDLIGEG